MSTMQERRTPQRPAPALGRLSTAVGRPSQARRRTPATGRAVRQIVPSAPLARAGLPALVKRVQSYLEVGRT